MLSKCSINISNGIPLLFSQSCGISAVPSEEQPPQIGHLPAHERKQLPGKLSSIYFVHYIPASYKSRQNFANQPDSVQLAKR